MPPFRFSLEQVLKYRTQLEEQAKVELAKVEAERRREQERVDFLSGQIAEQERHHAALSLEKMAEKWLVENFIKGLRSDLATSIQRVQNWNVACEAARQHLTMRAKEKKVLEKLKNTQAENHALEEKYREQQAFDETASIRYKAAY